MGPYRGHDREGVLKALRARASCAHLDELKLIPRGACFQLACRNSPASPWGPPKAMKLSLRCFFNRVFPDAKRAQAIFLGNRELRGATSGAGRLAPSDNAPPSH